ncbi:Oxidation resistance protein 1 [Merluccius polli]|uniref:Oxidation resistance protein 1 n=1 Tax=Merluccius polli TaxID=89951 RepID=A0AA47M2X2_MERPO|nr:Oxidation resistance protein 1 [Merluccius polli]
MTYRWKTFSLCFCLPCSRQSICLLFSPLEEPAGRERSGGIKPLKECHAASLTAYSVQPLNNAHSGGGGGGGGGARSPSRCKDSDGAPRPEGVHPPVFSSLRQSRVVSATSEEEEALTEKFLKINCKYITDGKGAVNGVLLVTPNNIMFDPHRTDPLVLAHGCEEYGIMCPLEEVQSAAIFKEITDAKIRDGVVGDLAPLPAERHPSQQTDTEPRPGANGGAAPRSAEGSVSEDVFTESELSPIREEERQASSDDLRPPPDKSSAAAASASAESVQTVTPADAAAAATSPAPDAAGPSSASQGGDGSVETGKPAEPQASSPGPGSGPGPGPGPGGGRSTEHCRRDPGPLSYGHSAEGPASAPSAPCAPASSSAGSASQARAGSSGSSRAGVRELGRRRRHPPPAEPSSSQEGAAAAAAAAAATAAGQEGSTDTMHPRPGNQRTRRSGRRRRARRTRQRRRKGRSHKFLCLRVGKPMKKTFVSNASASMQQYAQQGKKHEYWFSVPQERSDHLYVFFIQWSPDMYGEGVRGVGREPGFRVVKKNEDSEKAEDEPVTDINVKEWEVVSLTEYHRRIDALNSEDLRSLCKRLQITTKEEANSNRGTTIKTELEPETFKPNLSEPSDLLEAEQIEKLARNLPPRTIGYPWTLAFGTSKHGMSIKSLYRAMQGQDTPVLMVIKDSDGQVFGALASEPFKVSDGFYGTGETFLFTFNPEFEVFKWTGDNMFFIKGDMDSLAFGGGSGEFGLWLDGDLYHGRSHSCKTFGNPMLSKKEDFYVQDIEIWSFE